MTNQDAIKFLQQIYPNGGNCWLDEQRIEAIDMAVKALQEEPVSVWHYQKKEPVNEIADKSRPIIVVYGNNSLNAAGKFRCYEDNSDAIWLSNSYEKWAFVEDLISLSHSVTKVSWQEEPVSEDLEEAADSYIKTHGEILGFGRQTFKAGAKWQKAKDKSVTNDLGDYINELSKQFPEVSFAKLSRIAVRVAKWQNNHLWKSADGDDLPEIDREVIALLDNGKVVFAHRPPEYWDGKDIATGKVTRYYPKTYDKGGWNIPDVKWWLDCLMPKDDDD